MVSQFKFLEVPSYHTSKSYFFLKIHFGVYKSLHLVLDLVTADEDEGEFDYDDNGGSAASSSQRTLRPPGKDEIKNDQWLGVNVRSQGPGGMVMVCAHRYIN